MPSIEVPAPLIDRQSRGSRNKMKPFTKKRLTPSESLVKILDVSVKNPRGVCPSGLLKELKAREVGIPYTCPIMRWADKNNELFCIIVGVVLGACVSVPFTIYLLL